MIRTSLALAAAALVAGPATAQQQPAFNADVRPLLKAYCTDCHGEAEKLKGGLDLRLRRLAVAGGDSGPAVVPGKAADSPLVERVKSGDMPPGKKKLSAAEIAVLERWVAGGAAVEGPEPATLAPGLAIAPEDRAWWAFQPVTRPPVPKADAGNLVDVFLLAKLREKGLGFNRPADRVALIRRVTFDLTGLPPTPEEAAAFAADPDPKAYEKLVDRLLARPEYGERWGRHWLDVAGYADSEGGSPDDPVRTNAWKYRDYVIRAFNADVPFDRFVREQLAGDELVRPPFTNLPPADLDALTATGFLRMAPDGTGAAAAADQKLARNAVLTDTVKITASAFLGLTVGCAECHNHRYDPIPQTDFYRLRAAFEPGFDPTAWRAPAARQVSLYTPDERAMAAAVEAEAAALDKGRVAKQTEFIAATFEKELAKLPDDRRAAARAARDTPDAKRSPEQKRLMQEHPSLNVSAGSLYLYDAKAADALKAMAAKAAEMRKKKPAEEFVRALTEVPGKVPPTHLFHRGDVEQPKGVVPPGGLAVLDDVLPLPAPKAPPGGSSGRRLALANWLTDPRHPLTARVFVNRVWMHHFGRGLVGSPGDFGRLGERPTHPELLDWLAADFVANGWGVKRLHRLILTSAAYRQSSVREAKADALDPDNKLLGRFPLRRLDAEAVRDATLATSGKLNPKRSGPPVPVMEDDAGLVVIGKSNRDGAGYKLGDESVGAGEEFRRSVYVQVRRSRPLAVLAAFDPATTEPNCEARPSSTATPQALMLLNGEFAAAQAEAFAARVRRDAGAAPDAQLVRAWTLAYLRPPTEGELAGARSFLRGAAEAFAAQPAPPPPKKGAAAEAPTPEARALSAFCQALLASNRFLYVE